MGTIVFAFGTPFCGLKLKATPLQVFKEAAGMLGLGLTVMVDVNELPEQRFPPNGVII